MNIYAQILIDEAQKRGIDIEILDEHANLFSLRYKGQTVMCRESLTEKTSAIAMAICADKSLTHRWLRRAGIAVPHHEKIKIRAESLQALQETFCHPANKCANQELEEWQKAVRFMRKWKRIVVKPAHGEQGKGITVDISDEETLKTAIKRAQQYDDELIIEQFIQGKDVRIVVINYQFVAAIERIPASIQGDGTHTILQLIKQRNREQMAISNGESQIPINDETERVIQKAGYHWNDVLPYGERLHVCKTANYHTGGTIVDVTEKISPFLRETAEFASRVLNIPVVGLDFLIPDYNSNEYVIIEANERPGLANHEPQPTAEKFIDFLFPETKTSRSFS